MDQPKLSLVSAVRDRAAFLVRSLPHWLALPEIAEIVLVDYGSAEPVDPALFQGDPRCRLVRVENAPYWKLGKALNLAIAEAAGPLILKLDADAYIAPDRVPPLLSLAPGQFVTGVLGGSASGQALFWQADWAAVGGYHDFLAGWGYDDYDLYRRMMAAGFERFVFPEDALQLVEHGDELRNSGALSPPRAVWIPPEVLRHKFYSNLRNMLIRHLVPWNDALRERPARRETGTGTVVLTLEPPGALELDITEMAGFFAAAPFLTAHDGWLTGGLGAVFGQADETVPAAPVLPALIAPQ